MSSSNCCCLTCIQISQEAGQVVWYFHLLKNFPQSDVVHTIKSFDIVNKAEVDVFLKLSCFFDDPTDVGNLISGSSAFSKTSLNIWKFTVDILLKPGLENFEHYFASMWDECNCAVVWAFFGIAFLWDWNENWPFPVLWPLLSFPTLVVQLIREWFTGAQILCDLMLFPFRMLREVSNTSLKPYCLIPLDKPSGSMHTFWSWTSLDFYLGSSSSSCCYLLKFLKPSELVFLIYEFGVVIV